MHVLEGLVTAAMIVVLLRRAELLRRARRHAGPAPGPGLAVAFYALTAVLLTLVAMGGDWPLLWNALLHRR